MKRTRNFVVLALTAALLALPAAPVGAARALNQASGAGSFTASGGGGGNNNTVVENEFRFAFSARQLDDDGTATGQFTYRNVTKGNRLQMEIVEMTVVDDGVCLKGEITKAVGGDAQVGAFRFVKLQDNGQGANAEPDMSSKLSGNSCGELFELDRGNVKIH